MKIEIYEPAMCCSTGICGASVDPELLRISTLVDNLDRSKVEVVRYNLSSNPEEFIKNDTIQKLIARSTETLPITIVDGEVFKTTKYPSNEEFDELLGV